MRSFLNDGTTITYTTKTEDGSIAGPQKITTSFFTDGVYGAEGWQASNNLVSIRNIIIDGINANSGKLGVVGGRAERSHHLDSNFETWDKADNNIVMISNSLIGVGNLHSGKLDTGLSVYGGYSYGEGADNIVVIENSVIRGNIYGGLEIQGIAKPTITPEAIAILPMEKQFMLKRFLNFQH